MIAPDSPRQKRRPFYDISIDQASDGSTAIDDELLQLRGNRSLSGIMLG
jgi:hypothetical protein